MKKSLTRELIVAGHLVLFSSALGTGSQDVEWFKAIETGNLVEIDQMIKKGIDLNVTNEGGDTALMIAAKKDKEKVVERLIEGNPSEVLNMVLEWKNSGRKLSDQSILKWKNRITADVNGRYIKKYHRPPTWSYEWEEEYYNPRAWSYEWKEEYHKPPLASAVEKQNYRVVKLLIEAGADVNVIFRTSRYLGWYYGGHSEKTTPLIDAAGRRSEEIIKLLIDAGANVHVCSRCVHSTGSSCERGGNTAMDMAVEEGNVAAVKLLLNAGSDTYRGYLFKIANQEIKELMRAARYGTIPK